jgi:hypothetical protein
MNARMKLSPKPSVKTQTSLTIKIVAVVSLVGIIVTSVFFAISYFGSPKTSFAEGSGIVTGTGKTLIISEYASKGHLSQQRDEFIELYNISDSTINLSGYSLVYYQNNQSAKTVNLSGIIMPDSFFVIAIRNGSNSSSKPTPALTYNFIVPSPGWTMTAKGYMILKKGLSIIDQAGNSTIPFKENENYDRTDILVAGDNVANQWTKRDADKSTPKKLNYSDLPAISPVTTVGTIVAFGANSNLSPAITIKSSGTVQPGSTKVTVKRGKSPVSAIQMIKRYVDIEPTVQPNNVELVFYYHPSELNGLSESELGLYSYYNNTWHFIGGIVDSINNKITATGVNHFSRWSAGAKKDGNLPITLISFKGEYSGENVVLKWETASEMDNDYFTIERSKDGINFKLVGTEKGAGNSNVKIKYSATDENPFEDLTFYRLKQTDYDGKSEYFPTIVVRNNIKSDVITIEKYGPNPFQESVNIQLKSSVEGAILIKLFSTQGVVLKTSTMECQIGENAVELNELESLKPGTYYLQISSGTFNTKIVRLIKN